MTLAGKADRTIETYVGAVKRLSEHYNASPARLSDEQLLDYLLVLHRRGRAFSSINVAINAFRYLYGKILHRHPARLEESLPRPSAAKNLPRAYGLAQIRDLLEAAREKHIFHYTYLSCLYHTGLRLTEGCLLRFSEVERTNHRLLVKAGKGNKDRYTLLPDCLLEDFDDYYRTYRKHRPATGPWMFVGRNRPEKPLVDGSAQNMFYLARDRAGLPEIGGIHVLRHSFASHQLAAGMSLQRLREVLGHKNLTTTLRYLHLVVDGEPRDYDPRVSPLARLEEASSRPSRKPASR